MGHTIQHYDYPGNADKKKVEQELANYVAKRCFQEGGHLSKIRWMMRCIRALVEAADIDSLINN